MRQKNNISLCCSLQKFTYTNSSCARVLCWKNVSVCAFVWFWFDESAVQIRVFIQSLATELHSHGKRSHFGNLLWRVPMCRINNCFILLSVWHLWRVCRSRTVNDFPSLMHRLHSYVGGNCCVDSPHKLRSLFFSSVLCEIRVEHNCLNCCVQNNRYGNLLRILQNPHIHDGHCTNSKLSSVIFIHMCFLYTWALCVAINWSFLLIQFLVPSPKCVYTIRFFGHTITGRTSFLILIIDINFPRNGFASLPVWCRFFFFLNRKIEENSHFCRLIRFSHSDFMNRDELETQRETRIHTDSIGRKIIFF